MVFDMFNDTKILSVPKHEEVASETLHEGGEEDLYTK